ncbi:Uncharacterized protein FWK35_00023830 [Aphis craccivora]|uniref:HAT C-terminal dimerisation domain-containing protein n=1 Tax=Aphis craccivora TaxID=307492 RepID=A0A6G0Y676_APHCR|nr:Uncharacterized protein FWK35_00023830 [Aphis craccivora]
MIIPICIFNIVLELPYYNAICRGIFFRTISIPCLLFFGENMTLKNPLARLPLDAVDFCFAFNELANKNIVPPETLKAVQNRCFEFLIRLCEELLKRLRHNIKTIQKLRTDFEVLEIQWRNLTSLNYSDSCESSTSIDEKSTQEFCINVLNIRETGGKTKFEDLALFVLQILSLPLSNAIVERVFSVMNSVKCKPRNRMQY